jgi:hypothetical protein
MALTLSGSDTPRFLFLEVCEANRLQCLYSQHSTLETANERSCCTCHSRCCWLSVAGNGIPLRCLQSHQQSPHRTLINTWGEKKLFELFFNSCLMYVPYSSLRSRDSIVSIAASYVLDDRGVGVRVSVWSRISSSPRPDRPWGPSSLI